ncbi:ParB/RepB/Spo0J family partition protein [Massilia sp. CT11-137]|uniref:ParB/RepB/Spo0J family partition protein n=1 Tax=Massilia sp. CT11-137 TaxID=3393901 RepID=UPI0039A69C35
MTSNTLTVLPPPQMPVPTDQPIVVDELVTDAGQFGYFNLVDIRISYTNRKRFNQSKLDELAASIKSKGVAQPILIRPVTPTAEAPQQYEIVAGERRFRASIMAGLPTIPAMLRNLSDVEALELQILENLQRDDPHPLEEAEGYERLMLERNYDVDQLAEKLNKSRSYVYGRLKLCALTTSVREQFLDDKFSAATALLIARIPNPSLQVKAAKEVSGADWQGNPMSYRAQRDLLRQRFMLDLKSAVFPIKDAALLTEIGSCIECPKRSGNQQDASEGEKHENLCTDPDCFAEKTAAHSKKAKQKAEARGLTVISGEEAKKIMPNSYSNLKGGYADVDKTMWVSGGSTTYRKLLGKQLPKGVLLESPFEPGKLITIAKIDELEDLVTQVAGSGKTEASISAKQKAKEKQQEQAAAVERQFRRDLFIAIHDAGRVERAPFNEPEVAAQLFKGCSGPAHEFIIKLYGWAGKEFESEYEGGQYVSSTNKICAAIRKMEPDPVRQLIRDLTFVDELAVNTYTSGKGDVPWLMMAAAVELGIDAETMKKTLLKEAKKKADEKAAKKAKAASKGKKPEPVQSNLPDVAETPEPSTSTSDAAAPTTLAVHATTEQKGPQFKLDDVTQEDLVAYIRLHPEGLNALTESVLTHPRGELVGMLETAATSLGYTYRGGRAWVHKDYIDEASPLTTDEPSAQAGEIPSVVDQVEQASTQAIEAPTVAEQSDGEQASEATPAAADEGVQTSALNKKIRSKPAPAKKTTTISSKKTTAKAPAKAAS